MSVTFILMLFSKKIRHKGLFFFILCVMYTVVSTIRYDVGTDYVPTYVRYFGRIQAGVNYHYERLFLWLNQLVIHFNGKAWMLLGICAVFTILMFFHFIKNNVEEDYWFLSIYLFLTSTIYFATMNLVRQYMALAILLFGLDYLKKQHYVSYSICIVIAMLFHSSAVIAFLYMALYYLYSNKIWTKLYNMLFAILYCASIVFMFVDLRRVVPYFSFMIPDRYIGYLTSKFMSIKNYAAILKQVIPNFILFLMIKDAKYLKKEFDYFDLCFIGWIFYVLITNLFYGINLFIRLGFYFDYFILLVVPMLIYYYKQHYYSSSISKINIKRFDRVVSAVVIINYTALTIYSIFLNGGHGVTPYQTIFSIKN